ncbi:MAG TPA: hypothetical protein VJR29_07995 [bacterium]|nr:hypothetical protein [bacterium]
MVLPLALFLVPAALLLLSCDGEPKDSKKNEEKKPSPPREKPCAGQVHELGFGSERAQLCHGDSQKDGIFQTATDRLSLRRGAGGFATADSTALSNFAQKYGTPPFEGLHLGRWNQVRTWVFAGGDWSPTAELMTGGLARQLQSEGIAPAQFLTLAEQAQGSGTSSRVAALAIGGALLALQKEDSDFTRKHRRVLAGMIEGIRHGSLRIQAEPAGQKAPHGLMIYRSDLDAVLAGSLEPYRDTFSPLWFRSGLLHELYHYHQDAQAGSKDHLTGEREAYLFQAEYLASRPKAELEQTLVTLRKIYTQHPIFGALRAVQASSLASAEAKAGIAEADQAIQDIHIDLMFHLQVNSRNAFVRPSGVSSPEEALVQLVNQRQLRLKEIKKIAGKPSFERAVKERNELIDHLDAYLKLSVSAIGYRYAIEASRLPDPRLADRKELERLVTEGKTQVKTELRGYPVFRALEMRLDGVGRRP